MIHRAVRLSLTVSAIVLCALHHESWSAEGPGPSVWPPSPGDRVVNISGTYPHLAVFNPSGECGIGAVAVWADRLWFLTYPPHHPEGGEDKLYSVDQDLKLTIHPASVGGTHAGRMIHRESGQLILGPYFIDSKGDVRAADIHRLRARLTAVVRHLTDPAGKVFFFGMERELYEVDVRTLAVTRIYGENSGPFPGTHGKGAYTSQGRLVVANNGERGWSYARDPLFASPAGCLAESSGKNWKAPWTVVERKTFCEVTGPGGLLGNSPEDDRLWATGWDRRSVILKLLDAGQWRTYRLPKGSYSHDALHGWYTEWPRIRELQPGRMLMHMHGLFYDFPKTFSAANTAGLRPISTYLKMPVDYCWWNGRIVMARDDSSIMQNELAGQSNSALWFGQWEDLQRYGSAAGWGGPWIGDDVRAGAPSEPFLVAGFSQGTLHLRHAGDEAVTFTLEADRAGDGRWTQAARIEVPARGYRYRLLEEKAAWLRLTPDRNARGVTAYFHLANPPLEADGKLFQSLAEARLAGPVCEGTVKAAQGDARKLLFAVGGTAKGAGGLYQMDGSLKLQQVDDAEREEMLRKKYAPTNPGFNLDAASVIVSQAGQRLRLPKGDSAYSRPFASGWPRSRREVVTERSLLNAHGTFYELPRNDAGGLLRLRPVATHNRHISDFCSWRGLLVLAGTRAKAEPDGHFFASEDGKAGLWFGNVDDLWRLGKPRGTGGPWKDAAVAAGSPSDPYLMTGYDRKTLELRHDAKEPVTFLVEVDFLADGSWSDYQRLAVPPGQSLVHAFPNGYRAHWVRITADKPCRATAILVYE